MKLFKRLLVLASFCVATSAGAAEIWDHAFSTAGWLRWDGFDAGSTSVNVSKTNAPSTSYNGSGGAYRGYFYTDAAASADEFFRFFCIDLFETAATGPYQYTASVYTNSTLARLFDIAYPNKHVGDFYDGVAVTGFGLFGSKVGSAAFQLAVWEVFYETSATLGLTGGDFKSNIAGNASGTDAQKAVWLADTWLASLNSGAGSDSGWTLYKYTRDGRQDYLAAVFSANTVAEPSTLAMLVSAVLAAGLSRRRRR
jgi:hypothetical protein